MANLTLLCSTGPDFTSDGYLELMRQYLEHCIQKSVEMNMTRFFESAFSQQIKDNLLRLPELVILVVTYVSLLLIGSVGSLCVIIVVGSHPRMQNPHNMFTVNLAIGDLLLCLFTQPFNLLRVLYWHVDWTLGSWMCKAVETAQATNIFVSTFNISVIAIDRFLVIIHARRHELQKSTAVGIILSIWVISLLLASPVILYTSVSRGTFRADAILCMSNTVGSVELSQLQLIHGRITLVVQYLLPMTIVGYAYTRIYLKLRKRNKRRAMSAISGQNSAVRNEITLSRKRSLLGSNGDFQISSTFNAQREGNMLEQSQSEEPGASGGQKAVEISRIYRKTNRFKIRNFRTNKTSNERDRHIRRRQVKANALLLAITMTFILSWTPLHVFHLIMDSIVPKKLDFLSNATQPKSIGLHERNQTVERSPTNTSSRSSSGSTWSTLSGRQITIINALCLMCVHLTACINPILYGWLNEKFCKEFRTLFRKCFSSRQTF